MNLKIAVTGVKQLTIKRCVGPFWLRRRQLAKSQWFDKNKLQELQLNRLKKIVTHSYNTVPYYKKFMDEHGIRPESIRTLDDIKLFPVLSKKDVLEAEDSIISTMYPTWMLRAARTGGSTGTPLVIYRNWFSIGNEHAFVRRQWDWAGIGFSDRCAYFMSRVVAEPDQKGGRLYAYDPIMRDLILSTHHLSTETAKGYAEVMKRYRVKAVVGYPSAIGLLAKTCLDSCIELDLKAVLTTSEILTKSMHETIAKAFGCKVFDFYGSAERVCYIQTCGCGNYHVIPEYGLTELIPIDESDKNQCRIISTGFWNMAMPLIRYDMGDVVVKSNEICPCGRQFQMIESIDGREGDVIETSSGRRMGVTLIIQLLYVICGTRYIVESQIVQDSIDHLTINYVPTDKFEKKDLDDFRSLIAKYFPSELKFDLKRVKAVERTSSGKIRPVVSRIK
jgi:phenylacetate-CoA ligase